MCTEAMQVAEDALRLLPEASEEEKVRAMELLCQGSQANGLEEALSRAEEFLEQFEQRNEVRKSYNIVCIHIIYVYYICMYDVIDLI